MSVHNEITTLLEVLVYVCAQRNDNITRSIVVCLCTAQTTTTLLEVLLYVCAQRNNNITECQGGTVRTATTTLLEVRLYICCVRVTKTPSRFQMLVLLHIVIDVVLLVVVIGSSRGIRAKY